MFGHCWRISPAPAHSKCAVSDAVLGMKTGFLLQENLKYSCSFKSKILFSHATRHHFLCITKLQLFCLLCNYSVKKRHQSPPKQQQPQPGLPCHTGCHNYYKYKTQFCIVKAQLGLRMFYKSTPQS